MYAVSGGTTGYALYKVRDRLDEVKIPFLGIVAAFIFAAQMLNFPIAGGTSGHYVGALLACVLLGPWEGLLVMVVVLLVQGLFFADGGMTALGANLFNMGIVAGLCSYYLLTLTKGVLARFVGEKKSLLICVAFYSWLGVLTASIACAFELAVSGTVPLATTLAAMGGVYAVIGIGEAIIGVVVCAVVLQARPDLVYAYRYQPDVLAAAPGEVA
jgi:cobalt/nickel transport system permease protein